MTANLKNVKIAPKGMGLNDFVASHEGYFAEEGLNVEFDWKTFRGTQSSWKDLSYFERPQDKIYAEGQDVIQGACVWGSICNASAGMGRFVAEAYGVSPWAIFVRPDSSIHRPEDLKDVPIAVGMRAAICRPQMACLSGWRNICRSNISRPTTWVASAQG